MFVDKILFINRVPFEYIELSFKEKGINVLSAVNGKGKTTILSYITDAFYEMARPHYANSFKGVETKYYRISSGLDVIDQNKPSVVFIRFKNDRDIIDYIDCRGTLSSDQYREYIPQDSKISLDDINKELKIQGTACKIVSSNFKKEEAHKLFGECVLTSFPAYRYELPGYLNDPYKKDIHIKDKPYFSNTLTNPIEVTSSIEALTNWIMDIVVDWEVYKSKENAKDEDGNIIEIDRSPELELWKNLSTIVSSVLCAKHDGGYIRFGIGKRNNAGRRVSVVSDKQGNPKTMSPNLNALSSGESALLGLFAEILHQGDNILTNIKLSQINGIVLIDEIDKHLHIRLQFEILPLLLNLFPGIQFIVSSHSPFFNMGLAEQAKDRSVIFDLDNGANSWIPTVDESYKLVYDKMISENERYAKMYKENAELLKEMSKPIVITEGKTDWKHFKAALEVIKQKEEYSSIDFFLHEFSENQGDSELHKRLQALSKIPNKHKIIGIFDCDEDNGRRIHQKHSGIKYYGNNVYGMTIPIPDFRSYNSGISVEFLYKDNDLKKLDENNRRLYITSEFNEKGRLISDRNVGVGNADCIKRYLSQSNEKIKDNDVFDLDGNSLALSKENFAQNVLEKTVPFDNMDFSAFYPVFDRLKEILERQES